MTKNGKRLQLRNATPRSPKRIGMNFSRSPWKSNESECTSFFLNTVSLQYSSTDSSDGLLVAASVLDLVACPFTILLNVLVMVAVKTKRRLQTHPNILLACLALTDLMVGLVLQPLHITKTIFLLQGKSLRDFCDIELAFTLIFMILTFATLSHLLLISGERYLAIKHTFAHATVVTKARLIISSALVWIAAIAFLIVFSYLQSQYLLALQQSFLQLSCSKYWFIRRPVDTRNVFFHSKFPWKPEQNSNRKRKP